MLVNQARWDSQIGDRCVREIGFSLWDNMWVLTLVVRDSRSLAGYPDWKHRSEHIALPSFQTSTQMGRKCRWRPLIHHNATPLVLHSPPPPHPWPWMQLIVLTAMWLRHLSCTAEGRRGWILTVWDLRVFTAFLLLCLTVFSGKRKKHTHRA